MCVRVRSWWWTASPFFLVVVDGDSCFLSRSVGCSSSYSVFERGPYFLSPRPKFEPRIRSKLWKKTMKAADSNCSIKMIKIDNRQQPQLQLFNQNDKFLFKKKKKMFGTCCDSGTVPFFGQQISARRGRLLNHIANINHCSVDPFFLFVYNKHRIIIRNRTNDPDVSRGFRSWVSTI